jgi:hypothetical protein
MDQNKIPQLFHNLRGKTRILITLCFFICFLQHAKAQQAMEDVVYLKNGSIVRGAMIEVKKDTLVKIETTDRNTWVFPYKDIEKTTREPVKTLGFKPKTKGYYNVTSIGFIFNNYTAYSYIGQNSVSAARFCMNISNGYRFNRLLNVGAFISLNQFDDFLVLPVGLEIRGDILKTKITPIYSLQAGRGWCINGTDYNSNITDISFKPGWMLHPSFGLKFNGHQCAFITEIGFEYQDLSDSYNTYFQPIDEKHTYRRLSFKVGLMF